MGRGAGCCPSHFTFKDIFVAPYGERIDYVPVRSLIEAGIPFALGSDGPLNPYRNIMFAVMHPARPRQRLSHQRLSPRALSKEFLVDCVVRIPPARIREVDGGLRLMLSL